MDKSSHTVLVLIGGPEAAVEHTIEALLESNQVDYQSMGKTRDGDYLAITLFVKAPAQ